MQKLRAVFCIAYCYLRDGTKTNKYAPLTKAKNKIYIFAIELASLI